MDYQEEIHRTSELQLSLSPSSITISRGTMHQIGDPDYIQLMIDDEVTRIVVLAQPCDLGDTLPVPNDDCNRTDPVIYHSCSKLLSVIWEKRNWNKDMSYIVSGTKTQVQGLVVFDLLSAMAWELE